MLIHIPHFWWFFSAAIVLLIIAGYIIRTFVKKFYTFDTIERQFTDLDLEFASNATELSHILHGIHLLPADHDPPTRTVESAVRKSLWIDYILFMPAAYGAVFLLCMRIGEHLHSLHHSFTGNIFAALAWLQCIAFVLDGIENGYLLHQLKHHNERYTVGAFHRFRWTVIIKWAIVLTGSVCGLFTALYLLLSGLYF